MNTTKLYRHYDEDGVLLYVGISLNAVARLAQHRGSAHWFDKISKIDVEDVGEDRELALRLEKWAIENELPLYNKQNNSSKKINNGHASMGNLLRPNYKGFDLEQVRDDIFLCHDIIKPNDNIEDLFNGVPCEVLKKGIGLCRRNKSGGYTSLVDNRRL